jgi:hypothetical protein
VPDNDRMMRARIVFLFFGHLMSGTECRTYFTESATSLAQIPRLITLFSAANMPSVILRTY